MVEKITIRWIALFDLRTSTIRPRPVYSYNIFGVNFFQALTTFRDLTAQEFDFLPYLEQLEDLELGDCSEWETEVCIGNMSHHFGNGAVCTIVHPLMVSS